MTIIQGFNFTIEKTMLCKETHRRIFIELKKSSNRNIRKHPMNEASDLKEQTQKGLSLAKAVWKSQGVAVCLRGQEMESPDRRTGDIKEAGE